MENPQVVIKYISNGEKRYVGGLQQSSYSGYLSKRPFADPNVQKFDLKTALNIVEKSPLKSAFTHYQIIDNTGKVYYDNVGKIINEEVQRFLTEGFVVDNDNFKFKSQIRYPNVQFSNYESFTNDYDANVIDAIITVIWKAGFWVNDWGIENFFIKIESIEGNYLVELRDKQSDEVKQETQKNINDIKWKFSVPENIPLVTNGNLYIKDIEFDFKTNACKVNFYKYYGK